MKKSKGLSVLLIVAGVLILFFAWTFTGLQTQVFNPEKSDISSGTLYSANITMTDPSVFTVINVYGSYGLVPAGDFSQAVSGNLSEYSVQPSNVTGSSSWNVTYSGLSGKYAFIDIIGSSQSGSAPFLIMNTNAALSSFSGLIAIGSAIMIIGGIILYPYRKRENAGNEVREGTVEK